MRRWVLLASLVIAASCKSSPSAPAKSAPPTHATDAQQARAAQLLDGPDWYRHAVFYEIYVRSFADSNGDGIGDFAGLTSKLDYLQGLGVDAIWLMPIMPTAFKDSGYDVSDYRAIDADYGDMAAFDAFLAAAHARKMRVMLDLVLNHTSSQHAWFQDSRASKTGAHAEWYVWSDTPSRADIGCGTYSPQFGDSAWTFEPARGQYYFHRFYPEQPDLNYRNPAVVAETLDSAKFWLDKGVDGFRCDVIGLLVESASGCVMVPETVDYIKKLRALLDGYPDRAMVAESTLESVAPYFGSGRDMFHMAFDFPYGYFWGLAYVAGTRKVVFDALSTAATSYPPGAQDAMLIGSHDVQRAWQNAAGAAWRVQRAAEISMLAKGTPFVYYGDELGMHAGTGVVVDTRDSARTPMLWTAAQGHGFTTGTPWLPFGDAADVTSVGVEDADPDSMLTFYRELLAFRRGHEVWGTGDMRLFDVDAPEILAFERSNADEAYLVVESFSEDDAEGSAPAADVMNAGSVVWGDADVSVAAGTLHVKVHGTGSAVLKLR
jgi:alpha-glucosidase